MANIKLDEIFAICDQAKMEHLATYLNKHRLAQRSFAERVGCSPSFLSDLLAGRRVPGLSLAVRMERATGGEVKAVHWVPDVEAP
ncbi:helix-turn-helix domain-containing protein [Pseudogemmobacter faecipullorum]|uniref:Helix-turn-helix transcriptional regulator n=1 Tax=Pseudogemmobacter faecipullorum TaxID=2755041 RepID=A0ABS8CRY2_9RHOB|nr:helix-turn-helix transcriptional regulator [Pseudogemmobacter faecipullorum]MCB5412161.1 helix-turn-helix transcriptional regulator [Pseudogemmobacter faecipullorum]